MKNKQCGDLKDIDSEFLYYERATKYKVLEALCATITFSILYIYQNNIGFIILASISCFMFIQRLASRFNITIQ